MFRGSNVVEWDGRDEDGRIVYDGPYIVRLEADGKTATKVVTVINGQR